jgi:hypothetical protein
MFSDEDDQSKLEKKMKLAAEQQQADRDTFLIELRMLNSPEQLKQAVERLVVKPFKRGDIVDWEPGLRNRSVYGPFVVVEQIAEPMVLTPELGVDATTAGFLDPVDTHVMMRSSNESVLTMWLDSRHLRLVQ